MIGQHGVAVDDQRKPVAIQLALKPIPLAVVCQVLGDRLKRLNRR